MKKLQNNFTTPEQSKRLLELGLPADSADCLLSPLAYNESKKETIYNDPMIMSGGHVFSHYSYQSHKHMEWLPCWSAGRLIEIELTCRAPQEGKIARLQFISEELPDPDFVPCTSLMESLVRYLESSLYQYDFSKLEE